MQWDPTDKPRLRPVEAFRIPDGEEVTVGLRDRSGISDVVLSMSAPALQILALMDGEHTCDDIRREFQAQFHAAVSEETLHSLLTHLETAHFLDGPGFEKHYRALLHDYREARVRGMPHAQGLGIDPSGRVFDEMLSDTPSETTTDRLAGIIAPHLDYPRGRPCYAAAYGMLRGQPPPQRVVILGTNHFGRSTGVVATARDFQTPLGTTCVDLPFLEKLEASCGGLRNFELDHAREHSVELQVAWLQFLFGPTSFRIVPFLCPDPTAPLAPGDVGPVRFASALNDLLAEDGRDTLLVAGADLSHVGANFGDDRPLDEAFLAEVQRRDDEALDRLAAADGNGFVLSVARDDNPTRMCSAGCMYCLAAALPDASPRLLRYHQAVDQETQTCVTCAAVAYAATSDGR